jgi:hypothetical protein
MKPTPPVFSNDDSLPSPAGSSDSNDLAMADIDNYAPPKDEIENIKCMSCVHFFHRKHLAISWSTRPSGNRRLEGSGTCLFTNPPTPLVGEYVVFCNKYMSMAAAPGTETK